SGIMVPQPPPNSVPIRRHASARPESAYGGFDESVVSSNHEGGGDSAAVGAAPTGPGFRRRRRATTAIAMMTTSASIAHAHHGRLAMAEGREAVPAVF